MKLGQVLAFILGLLVFVQACKDDEVEEPTPIDGLKLTTEQLVEIDSFLVANSIAADSLVAQGAGYYRELVVAKPEGIPITAEQAIKVEYKITTLDGQILASTQKDGMPTIMYYSFKSETTYTPLAFFYALKGSKPGETVRIYAPSVFGYFSYANTDLGLEAYEPIIVEVKIVEVYLTGAELVAAKQAVIDEYLSAKPGYEKVVVDGVEIYKTSIEAGSGNIATNSDTVNVYYTASYFNGVQLDSNVGKDLFKVNLSLVGNEMAVIKGFRAALLTMKVGETSRFVLPSDVAYGNGGSYTFPFEIRRKLPLSFRSSGTIPVTPLVFEITLNEIL